MRCSATPCWNAEAMWRETNLFGIYMSPLVVYMFAAGVVYAPIQLLMGRLRAFRWIWNPPLAGMGVYLCILGVLMVWL